MPKRRLKTLGDLRRYVADLILRVEADKCPQSKARILGYLVGVQRALIEQSDIEERLQKLEEAFLDEKLSK